MPKLPQVNIRLALEHHGLIRELAQRLRADPSLAVGLAEFLAQASESEPTQVSPLAYGLADTDVLQAFQERLTIQSEGLQRIMAFAENINERVKALEDQMAGMKAAPPRPVQVEPRQPRPPMAGKRRPPTPITDDIRRQVHDLRASGMSRDAVAKELELGGSTVSRILDAPRPPDIPST
jgi:hypothetical protein